MTTWYPAAAEGELPPGTAKECVAGDRIVALFNVDGTIHALDGICPHQGGPLGKGQLQGCIVTCPWHGWQFDVSTGRHQTSKTLVQGKLLVKVDQGQVLVALEPVSP
jgi:nitrite reductase (NADH) small subunit